MPKISTEFEFSKFIGASEMSFFLFLMFSLF